MIRNLLDLYKYRELLITIAYRDIRVRYKQSIMGVLWAVLMPILIVMSGIVVRYAYALAAHVPLKPSDIGCIAVKSVPWAFLVSSIRFGCNSLTANRDLVTKVYFPKEVFPIGAMLACFFDLCIASVALVILLVLIGVGWSIYIWWAPLLLFVLVLIATGTGMIVSAASLFFRDVRFLVEVLLTFAIFFTPVFYDIGMLGRKGHWLLLNPVSPLLEGLGDCVVHHAAPELWWLAYAVIAGVVATVAGYAFFKHLEPAFAEGI